MKNNYFMFLALLFGFATFMGAQSWTVYDCSVIPSEETDISFSNSNLQTISDADFNALHSVQDGIMTFEIMPATDERGMDRVYVDAGTKNITFVTKIKGTNLTSTDWVVDIDIQTSGIREQIYFQSDNTVHFNRGDGGTVALPSGVSLADWHTFRITVDVESADTLVNLYIDESTDVFASSKPITASNNYFRFGSGSGGKKVGYMMDYMMWDETGAYAPGEGAAIPKPSIIFITDDDNDDIQVDWLKLNGFNVVKFWPGSLAAAGQDTIDMLNAADLIIIGRSGNSGDFDGDDQPAWNKLTAPLILNSQWMARSSRLKWFNSSSAVQINETSGTTIGHIKMPSDPIFDGITTDGDSLEWTNLADDYISIADTVLAKGAGEVLVQRDGAPLVVRFPVNIPFYPEAGDSAAGPRTYFGMGNDAAGPKNYFNLTNEAKNIYFAEITRMLGISKIPKLEPVNTILFITDASRKDSVQIELLKTEGYPVTEYIAEDFYAVSQDSIDKINKSGVIIFGRGPSSSSLNAGSGYALQKRITRPIIMNGVYAARNGGWFANKGPVHYQDGDGATTVRDTIYARIQSPSDEVFSGVTLLTGDSIGWSMDPEDLFIKDTMTLGDVVALATNVITKGGMVDTAFLMVRWTEGEKMFEGISAQTGLESYIPAAPRTYFGFGNDAIGTKDHYYTLTEEGKVIYLAEIDRLINADYNANFYYPATNSNIGTITADIAEATFNTPVNADTLVYTLTVPNGTAEVILTATTDDANATVLDASKYDAVDTVAVDASAKFTVTAEDGFGTTVYTVNVVEAEVGIKTLAEAGVALYPNPAKSNLTVEGLELNSKVNIINTVGQLVYTGVANNNTLDINLNNLNQGIYLIRVEMNNQVYTSRFIKQ